MDAKPIRETLADLKESRAELDSWIAHLETLVDQGEEGAPGSAFCAKRAADVFVNQLPKLLEAEVRTRGFACEIRANQYDTLELDRIAQLAD